VGIVLGTYTGMRPGIFDHIVILVVLLYDKDRRGTGCMNSLYKRIITLGMVSLTALLAWIYCIVTFPKQLVYLAIISLVVVVSLYALLNALTGLHIENENKLQAYFKQTTSELVEKTLEANNSEESERLAKATYVQIRKNVTTLKDLLEQDERNHEQDIVATKTRHDEICMLMTDSINKATKIVVKYNETYNDRIVENIETLSSQVAELKLELGGESTASNKADYTTILNDILSKLDALRGSVDLKAYPVDDVTASATPSESVPEANTSAVNVLPADDMGLLDQSMIDSLLSGEDAETDDKTEKIAEDVTEEVTDAKEIKGEDENPNKQLSADEIAALFASASTDKEEKAEETSAETAPVEEKSESAPSAPPEDPGRPLTPDEIAALFSSMSG
jgi:hypothetical protein